MTPEAARFTRDLRTLAPVPTATSPLALAVSGGPDSMAMLALAAAAFPDAVIAATVDHRLRAASAQEAGMVANWCRTHAVPHATLAPDAPPAGASIQAQARHLRYALLADWALAANAVALATAHHADDQAETFLMRAVRGSGPAGLAGIRPRWLFRADRWSAANSAHTPEESTQSLPIIRPLLAWRRADLRAIAADLPFIDDPSNSDPRHDRTHARALLAASRLDPRALAASAAHCREADAALRETVDWLWRTRRAATDSDMRIDVTDLPRELRRRLARRAITELRAVHAITEGRWSDAANIESLLNALESQRKTTQAGILASAAREIWHFRPAPPRRLF